VSGIGVGARVACRGSHSTSREGSSEKGPVGIFAPHGVQVVPCSVFRVALVVFPVLIVSCHQSAPTGDAQRRHRPVKRLVVFSVQISFMRASGPTCPIHSPMMSPRGPHVLGVGSPLSSTVWPKHDAQADVKWSSSPWHVRGRLARCVGFDATDEREKKPTLRWPRDSKALILTECGPFRPFFCWSCSACCPNPSGDCESVETYHSQPRTGRRGRTPPSEPTER
jgi:hypothetical protein